MYLSCQAYEFYYDSSIPLLDPAHQQQIVTIDSELPDFYNDYPTCYTLWTKFQPYVVVPIYNMYNGLQNEDYTEIRSQNPSSPQFINLFQNQKDLILTHYIEFNQEENSINHVVQMKTKSGNRVYSKSFDILTYEGIWMFNQLCFDDNESKTRIGFYKMDDRNVLIDTLDFIPYTTQRMIHIIGGGGYLQDPSTGQQRWLSPFTGKLSSLYLIFNYYGVSLEEYISWFDFLSGKYEVCKQQQVFNLLNQQTKITSKLPIILTIPNLIENRQYTFAGWVKLQTLNEGELLRGSVLLRITINNPYEDDSNIGDRLLYIKYYQNLNNKPLNGIEFHTYSIDFPLKQPYVTREDDIIQIFDVKYETAIVAWHFIAYEYSGINAKITVYFPNIGSIVRTWQKEVLHFTGVQMKFVIGGSEFSTQEFQGIIDSFKFYYCYIGKLTFLRCHHSCKTCDGPSENDCLQCSTTSNRYYKIENKSCPCGLGYIDFEEQIDCQLENQFHQSKYPMIKIVQQAFYCSKIGYQRCDHLIECSFGYFLYQGECLQWYNNNLSYSPSSGTIVDSRIFCADCMLNPKSWYLDMKCSFDLIKSDTHSQFIRLERSEADFNGCLKVEKIGGVSQLIQNFGCLRQIQKFISCKKGFYKYLYFTDDTLVKCDKCNANCLCDSEFLNKCNSCIQGFAFNIVQRKCDPCPNCLNCEYLTYNNKLVCIECRKYVLLIQPRNQFLKNGICQACGDMCAKCNSERCLICQNPINQFISLDSKSCNECAIKYCLQCYQMTSTGAKYIQTTLQNLFDPVSGDQYTIITACARCADDYYLSQDTLHCIYKGDEIITQTLDANCLTGIIQENIIVCLIGKIAIETTTCDPLINCVICIKQYNQNYDFCTVCTTGFYSHLITGSCNSCPQLCKTCAQQQVHEQYFNRQKIRAFYHYKQLQGVFEQFSFPNHDSILSIICTSCQKGYIIFQDTCIQGCSEDCLNCQIVDGKVKCLQCSEELQTNYVMVPVDGYCLHCPNHCISCQKRSQMQLQAMNQMFDSAKFTKYTNQCYEQVKNSKFQFDNEIGRVVQCNNDRLCVNSLFLEMSVYFNENQYEEQRYAADNQQIFDQQYFMAADFSIITPDIIQYLNEQAVQNGTISLNVIQGPEGYGQFTELDSKLNLRNQVASLKKLHLELTSKKYTSVNGDLDIYNFSSITILGLQFSDFFLFIKIMSFNESVSVTLKDLNFSLATFGNKILNFNFYSLETLTIENCIFSNFNFSTTTEIFIFGLNNEKLQSPINIILKNITFQNCKLSAFSFMQLNTESTFNYTVLLQDVRIINSTFNSNSFLSTQYQYGYSVGNFSINNLEIINTTLSNNSILLNITGADNVFINNISIVNSTLLDYSSLLVTNIINITQIRAVNTVITYGRLIEAKYIDFPRKESEKSSLVGIIRTLNITNCTYYGQSSFIKISSDDNLERSLNISEVYLSSNRLASSFIGSSGNNVISPEDANIYLQCSRVNINQLTIYRGPGYQEISVIGSKVLVITNVRISTSKIYFKRCLHSELSCSLHSTYLQFYHILYINKFEEITFDQIVVISTILVNYPLIAMQSRNDQGKNKTERIIISNSYFSQNILIITDNYFTTSLINILSQQSLILSIRNTQFISNHLHKYKQDLSSISATTIHCSSPLADIQLTDSKFIDNIVTNSVDSILLLTSKQIYISKCQFSGNNVIKYDIIRQNIIYGFQVNTTSQSLYRNFPVLSQSGNGQFLTSSLTIEYCTIVDSFAQNGGGFYISTQDEGKILIRNCNTINTHTLLSFELLSRGGLLYIDAAVSQLSLQIHNCTITDVYSLSDGGAIFINPSQSKNYIQLNNIQVQDSYSLLGAFLSVVFLKQAQEQSFVEIRNMTISASKEKYLQYLSKFPASSSDMQNYLSNFNNKNENLYISITEGNVMIIDCEFINNYAIGSIRLNSPGTVILENIVITGLQLLFSSMISLTSSSGQIVMNNIRINDVKRVQENILSILTCLSDQKIFEVAQINCPTNTTLVPPLELLSEATINYSSCLQDINTDLLNVAILSISDCNSIVIRDLKLQNIYCPSCSQGGMRINNVAIDGTVELAQISSLNNNCGKYGCIYFTNSPDTNLTLRMLEASKQQQIRILQSLFANNLAENGAGLVGIGFNVNIENSLILNNTASLIGGGIYYSGLGKQLFMKNTLIDNNRAKIGGGIYLTDQFLQQTMKLGLKISDNTASDFGADTVESPSSLSFSINTDNVMPKKIISQSPQHLIEQVQIAPYTILGSSKQVSNLYLPTGQEIGKYAYFDYGTQKYIPYNITFRIVALNSRLQRLKQLEDSTCTINSRKLQFNSSNNTQIQFGSDQLSLNSIQFNTTTQDYNLDNLIIRFSPYNLEEYLQLQISCGAVRIPVYDTESPYSITRYITNYTLLFNLQTFICQIGERYNEVTQECIQCDSNLGYYQVKVGSTRCYYKDDKSILGITSATIELKQVIYKLFKGYWRPYFNSDIVEECYHSSDNCQGGWIPGDASCTIGSIGALCEHCDIYNIKSEGQFSISKLYTCGSCDQIITNTALNYNYLMMRLQCFKNCLYQYMDFVFNIIIGKWNSRNIEIGCSYLKFKNIQYCSYCKQITSSAILIKAFTNYLQIVTAITTFQIDSPQDIATVVNSVGNPLQTMGNALDCFLVNISNIDILYFRMIWGLLIPFFYILIFLQGYLIGFIIKALRFNWAIVTTTLIYMYIYLSPNIIGGLISLISYRRISGVNWVQGNVAYKYDTDSHYTWLFAFALPVLLIVAVLIPFILWLVIYLNRNQLNNVKVRTKWGYLYNEYKLNAFFWESIKIAQKEIIIIVLTYYEDYIPIKAALCVVTLYMYNIVSHIYTPFYTGVLNRIDSQSTSVCAISIILASAIYTSKQASLMEIVWICYLAIGILNGLFLIKILVFIILTYTQKLEESIDQQETKQMRNGLPYPNAGQRRRLVILRFSMIRNSLMSQAKTTITQRKLQQQIVLKDDEIQRSIQNQEILMTPARESGASNRLIEVQIPQSSLYVGGGIYESLPAEQA